MKRKIKEREVLRAQGRLGASDGVSTDGSGNMNILELFGGLAKMWTALTTFGLCFYCRYGTLPMAFVWIAMVAVLVQLPALLRQYWKQPSNLGFQYYYCAAFDSLSDSKVMFYSAYEVCAVIGLIFDRPYAYTFHLMDLIVQSATLQNVVKAVTNPMEQLVMTSILGVMVIYVFAIFAFFFFQGSLVNGDTGQNECEDVLVCFTMMLHKGLMMGGGIADYMSYELGHVPLTMEPNKFIMRLIYDLLFFIIVLVLLRK